jgi:hypothetical protein
VIGTQFDKAVFATVVDDVWDRGDGPGRGLSLFIWLN